MHDLSAWFNWGLKAALGFLSALLFWLWKGLHAKVEDQERRLIIVEAHLNDRHELVLQQLRQLHTDIERIEKQLEKKFEKWDDFLISLSQNVK